MTGEGVPDALTFAFVLICFSAVIRKKECAILAPARRTACPVREPQSHNAMCSGTVMVTLPNTAAR